MFLFRQDDSCDDKLVDHLSQEGATVQPADLSLDIPKSTHDSRSPRPVDNVQLSVLSN